MSPHTSFPTLPRGRRLAAWAGACVLLLSGLVVLTPDRTPIAAGTTSSTVFNSVVHWKDASHDWLIVADRTTDQLVVYDALDGRPLHRLGAGEGLADVNALAVGAHPVREKPTKR